MTWCDAIVVHGKRLLRVHKVSPIWYYWSIILVSICSTYFGCLAVMKRSRKRKETLIFQISKLGMNRLYMLDIFVFNSFLRCKLAFCDFLGWRGLWVSGNHETQHKKEGNIIKSANKVDTRWIIAVFPALLSGTSQSVTYR